MQYVKEQTEEICLSAVKNNGYALQYVKEQTGEICLSAVKQNGNALQYVKEQTEEMCLEAVKNDWHAFLYVKEQTEEICLEVVKENPLLLDYMENVTELIGYTALKNAIRMKLEDYEIKLVFNYIENKTNKIYKLAFEYDYSLLGLIENQDERMCLELIKEKPQALMYVKRQKEKICIEALKNAIKNKAKVFEVESEIYINEYGFIQEREYISTIFKMIKKKTKSICLLAVKYDPYILQYIDEQDEDIILEAIKVNPKVVCCIKDKKVMRKMKKEFNIMDKEYKNKKSSYSDSDNYSIDYNLLELGESYEDYYDELDYVD